MSGKHANISIFVPHIGCPNRCSFCDQHSITGCVSAPTNEDVDRAVAIAITSKNYRPEHTEIAFFGGSFTAIQDDYRRSLLKAAAKWVENGTVCGIRISTRPDAIDDEILLQCKQYHVSSIELGAQSLEDEVLQKNHRGHTAQDVVAASRKIKEYGFSLGLQMMTGLFGDCEEYALETAQKIIELGPDTVRIYPTIVFRNTALARLYEQGEYRPQTVEEAVQLGATLLQLFHEAHIPVIRFGLHTVRQEDFLAGPWHPALRELCESEWYYRLLTERLKEKGPYWVRVSKSAVSKMVGQQKENLKRLEKAGYRCRVRGSEDLKEYEIEIEKMKEGEAECY